MALATEATTIRMETPLIHEEQSAGARFAEYNGCHLPELFSSFDAEYRTARESVALFDTNWHAVVELTGPDRVRYLNAIVSNDVKTLGEGMGTLALLLNPQGHILAELEICALQDKLLVLSHASVRERTIATLDKFIIMDDVTLSDVTEQFGSIAVEGPRAGTVIAGGLRAFAGRIFRARDRGSESGRSSLPSDPAFALWSAGRGDCRAARASADAVEISIWQRSRVARRADRNARFECAAARSGRAVVPRRFQRHGDPARGCNGNDAHQFH